MFRDATRKPSAGRIGSESFRLVNGRVNSGVGSRAPSPPLVRFEAEGDGEKVELPAATRQEMHSMAYQRLPIAFMEYTHGI